MPVTDESSTTRPRTGSVLKSKGKQNAHTSMGSDALSGAIEIIQVGKLIRAYASFFLLGGLLGDMT
jgi:hypothetical protein